mmetsp:Transcript_56479/g.47615  ORF Transcript_56479/g.47615 Transcript_56479/m.47615 type:complete len:101 (+) Transcript_56479:350-652(+)
MINISTIPLIPLEFTHSLTTITSGQMHTCVIQLLLLVKRGGTIGCWGDNSFGQGETPEGFLDDIVQISNGDQHTCAVSVHHLGCWGSNRSHQADVPEQFR